MSYLQTNTRLENLEVVERVCITLHHDWHYGGKKDDILNITQFSTFNKHPLLKLMFVYPLLPNSILLEIPKICICIMGSVSKD